jgi:hypothetical protein
MAVVSVAGFMVVSTVAGAAAGVSTAGVSSLVSPPHAVKATPAIIRLMATRIVLVDLIIGDFFCGPKIAHLAFKPLLAAPNPPSHFSLCPMFVNFVRHIADLATRI